MTPEQIIAEACYTSYEPDNPRWDAVAVRIADALRLAGYDLDHTYRSATERECMNGAHALMELFVRKENGNG
jgi:hypothetical protein